MAVAGKAGTAGKAGKARSPARSAVRPRRLRTGGGEEAGAEAGAPEAAGADGANGAKDADGANGANGADGANGDSGGGRGRASSGRAGRGSGGEARAVKREAAPLDPYDCAVDTEGATALQVLGPVSAAAWALMGGKHDVVIHANAGEDRALSYLVPLVSSVLAKGPGPTVSRPRVLVVSPVRDMGKRVHAVARCLCSRSPLAPQLLGSAEGDDMRLCVGTASAALKLLSSDETRLSELEAVVFEEGSRFIDEDGELDDVNLVTLLGLLHPLKNLKYVVCVGAGVLEQDLPAVTAKLLLPSRKYEVVSQTGAGGVGTVLHVVPTGQSASGVMELLNRHFPTAGDAAGAQSGGSQTGGGLLEIFGSLFRRTGNAVRGTWRGGYLEGGVASRVGGGSGARQRGGRPAAAAKEAGGPAARYADLGLPEGLVAALNVWVPPVRPMPWRALVFAPNSALGEQLAAALAPGVAARGGAVFGVHSKMGDGDKRKQLNDFRGSAVPCLLVTSDAQVLGMDFPNVQMVVQVGFCTRVDSVARLMRLSKASGEGAAGSLSFLLLDAIERKLMGALCPALADCVGGGQVSEEELRPSVAVPFPNPEAVLRACLGTLGNNIRRMGGFDADDSDALQETAKGWVTQTMADLGLPDAGAQAYIQKLIDVVSKTLTERSPRAAAMAAAVDPATTE